MKEGKWRKSDEAYAEAKLRILEAVRNEKAELDLSGLGLTELPPSIGQLTQLRALRLWNNQLTSLPDALGQLTQLRRLYLSGNRLTSLPEALGQLTQLRRLYLSGNTLASLPEALGQLTQLQTLHLTNNQLTSFPEALGQLTQLRMLDLSGNRLTSLPEALGQLTQLQTLVLSDNQLTSLPEALGQLTQLQKLVLSDNELPSLPEVLGQLTQLETLSLSRNQLTSLPKALDQLTQLGTLYVSRNQLTSLPETLGQLTHLRWLDLSGNLLKSLPEALGQLTQLWAFNLSDNQLMSLPETLGELMQLQTLHLHGNNALGVPAEVLGRRGEDVGARRAKLTSPREILDYYFRVRAGKRPLNEAKLILVGRGGAGKTCIIKRLIFGTFDKGEKETAGIEIQPWEVKVPSGDSVRLHVWDFGGQEILHATHQFFLTERTLYLLVLSGREGKPTEEAEYWLQLIRSFGGDSKVIIALNKSDEHPFDVNRGLLLEKYPFIVDFVKTDCGVKPEGLGIAALKRVILEQTDAMEHRKTGFPAQWFAIKERLAQMAERNENYVTWEQYQSICRDLGESDKGNQERLARYLHLLGVALNYRDEARLKDTHVLNPRWVTEGIYPLLRTGQKDRREGVLELNDFARVLDAKRYPSDRHEFLVSLMERFQLCFPLPTRADHAKQWLVPELLGEDQPEIKGLLEQPGLGFRYQYEVLPEGVLPRFIVQTHRHSEGNPQWRWRTGVVLAWDDCRAVVRGDYRERRVDIHVIGPAHKRRELLAVIREKFEEQHHDLKGVNVEERVVVSGEASVTVGYRHLLRLEEDGEEVFRPEGARGRIRVADLLNGVESPDSRARRREKRREAEGGDVFNVYGSATIQTGDGTMQNIGRDKKTGITVGTNYGQVGEVWDHCSDVINQQTDGPVKELLGQLRNDVAAMIASLPAEGADEPAKDLDRLVDAATAKTPNRRWYSVSAAGLLEASKFAKEFTGNIAGAIGKLGRLLWPDFTLPETKED